MTDNDMGYRFREEKRLHQHGTVVWMTGLSGAGKTTLAVELEKELHQRGFLVRILDNDEIRRGLNRDLGFNEEDRHENLRRIAEVAKLFCDTGVIVLATFISPTEFSREQAKHIIGEDDFILAYVNASFEVCEKRDVKGLYKKARMGLIKLFTGIDSPYEPPAHPDIEIRTDRVTVREGVAQLLHGILPKIVYSE